MLPKPADIMALRANKNDSYIIFCDYFLSQVVGRNDWKKRRHVEVISSLATVSDEAFAILLLMNSWDMWIEMVDEDEAVKKGKSGEQQQGQVGGRKHTTTKWTQSGAGTRKYGGWKEEGLKMFNLLAKKIMQGPC